MNFVFWLWVSVGHVPTELTLQFLASIEICMASWFSHYSPFFFFPPCASELITCKISCRCQTHLNLLIGLAEQNKKRYVLLGEI